MADITVDDYHLDVYMRFADGLIHEVSAEQIRPHLDPGFPQDRLDEYLQTYQKPSQIPGFREAVRGTINRSNVKSIKNFRMIMAILDTRVTAPLLTNSLQLARDMSDTEREQLLTAWRDSPISAKRKLFRSLYALTLTTFAKLASELHLAAMGFPGHEGRTEAYPGHTVDDFRYSFLDKPHVSGHELYMPGVDAIVIGSGSGAGVVAHTLAEQGFKSLVIEKGRYFHPSEFPQGEEKASAALYERGGAVTAESQHIFVSAGSTFGGGSTVNWSASLKTPFKVRKEWYDDYGCEWAATQEFDDCLDYVARSMGATTADLDHSFSNRVVLDAGKKLGVDVREVPQNNGPHESHNCGLCHHGCRFGIKQGSAAFWFRKAAETGSQFMEQTTVVRVLHKKGRAYAVECQDNVTGVTFKISGPKHFVVAGGSLNTPVVLQKSGFKNKHIGSNLKLHPATVVFGDFGKQLASKPYEKPILSTVCCAVDDLDGKAHGAKIETILHTPFIETALMPWQGSAGARINMLRYRHMSGILLLDRDLGSGKVTYDPAKPDAFIIDYEVCKYDRRALLKAGLLAADMLYIEGALEIIPPESSMPTFTSNKPKHARNITDADYQQWKTTVARMEFRPWTTQFASAHQMSSCRMASSSKKGACDTRGKLWECSNVWVADASALPTASGVNPMVSTMAVARHNALELAKELRPGPKL
ncbi:hypothetical protein DICA2_A03114 [Diutina catenulata]